MKGSQKDDEESDTSGQALAEKKSVLSEMVDGGDDNHGGGDYNEYKAGVK